MGTGKSVLRSLINSIQSNMLYWFHINEQRYYTNNTFYKPGGPVFLMIGGEGEATAKWMVQGAWVRYAQEFNALCFQVEHRFYGKSKPTKLVAY